MTKEIIKLILMHGENGINADEAEITSDNIFRGFRKFPKDCAENVSLVIDILRGAL